MSHEQQLAEETARADKIAAQLEAVTKELPLLDKRCWTAPGESW